MIGITVRRKALELFLLCLIVGIKAEAQTFIYKNFTTENGLPSNEVYQVFKDSRSYMWFATDNGVCRFDGLNFTTFKSTEGLPGNTVFSFYEDYKNRLWILCMSGELAYFDNNMFVPYKYNSKIRELENVLIPNSFKIDSLENVSISYNRGFSYLINNTGTIIAYKNKNFSTVLQLDFSNVKTPFISFFGDPNRTDSVHVEIFDKGKKYEFNNVKLLIDQRRFYAVKSKSDDFLFLTGNRIYRFNKNGKYSSEAFNSGLITIYEDSYSTVFLGTFSKGALMKQQGDSGFDAIEFLKEKSVCSFVEDLQGGLWISTLEEGIYYIKNYHALQYKITGNGIKITGIAKLEDKLIVGSAKGDVYFIDNNKVIDSVSTYGSYVYNLILDSVHKQIFVFTNTSSCVYRKYNRKILGYELNFVGSACPGQLYDNQLLAGLSDGIISINFETGISRKIKSTLSRVSCLHVFNDTIFMGNYSGLYYLKDTVFQLYKPEINFFQKRITVLSGSTDYMLIGSRENGFVILKKNGDTLLFNKQTGLNGEQVRNIRTENNNIIVSTDKGISILKMPGSKAQEINNYSLSNGLSSNDCLDAIMNSDVLYVANNKGINILHLNNERNKKTVLPVYITSVYVDNKVLNPVDKLNLAYDENSITVNYNMINFESENSDCFRYKLLGIDEGWSRTKNRSITFSELPVGEYTLVIESCNKFGSVSSCLLVINVSAPFWKSGWFKILILLISNIVIFLIVRAVYLLKLRQKLKKANEATLIHKERARIATDIHDDLGADLTRLTMLVNKPGDNNNELKEKVKNISGSLNLLMDKMDEVIWMLNPTNDTINNLLSYIRGYTLEFFENSIVKTNFNIQMSSVDIMIPSFLRRDIFLIVKEMLNNIMKHAEAESISVSAYVEAGFLYIEISDDGDFFEASEKLNSGNGLFNMNKRIKQSGSSLEIRKNNGKGMIRKMQFKISK